MSGTTSTPSVTPGLLLKDQEKTDKADEAKSIANRKLISEATKSVLDIVTMYNDASFADFRKNVKDNPEFLVILEDSNGKIIDASKSDVKIQSVKYYKDNLTTQEPVSDIGDMKWQPGRAFFIDFTWTRPTGSTAKDYSTSIASPYDASFILECYSTEIEKRDIKPGSVYYKRNVYEATDNKKAKVVEQIDINMAHLNNLKKYLEDAVAPDGSTEKYEIIDASDGITGKTSLDPEVIFGKGTLGIGETIKNYVYIIPENVIKVFNRVSDNVTNIKTILDTTSYKYNYSIDRWREFVIDYTENISNYANSAPGKGSTAELLVGQKDQLTEHGLTDFTHKEPDIFYKACKDAEVTSVQKRELYSLSAFDKDFKNMVYFDPTALVSGSNNAISLGPNYKYGDGSAAVQIYLTSDGEYKDLAGSSTYYWVNASSSTTNIDDTKGQIKFLEKTEALALFGTSSRKDNLKMYQHLNKNDDEGYSNVVNSFGGKRKTKKRRTHKKRSSRKRR